MDQYEGRWSESRGSKMFDKLKTIRQGEFKRVFKIDEAHDPRRHFAHQDHRNFSSKALIPQTEIARFEGDKRLKEMISKRDHKTALTTPNADQTNYQSNRCDKNDIDCILKNRKELERLRGKADNDESVAASEYAGLTAVEKIGEGVMRNWVEGCYESLQNPEQFTPEEIEILVEWNKKQTAIEAVVGNIVTEGVDGRDVFETLDQDVSSDVENLSSEGSERDLRRKVARDDAKQGFREPVNAKKKSFETEKIRKPVEKLQKGITVKLEEFYIHDLEEFKSLAYDEELCIFHPNGEMMGSWRVNVKICEDDDSLVNVQFEGLLARGKENTTNCMYSSGLVDRFYSPLTEFRVEQASGLNGISSKTMFFHEKRRRWHFDLRKTENREETSRTFKLHYNQMLHVVTESAHILLMRKIVMYRCPLMFDPENHMPNCLKISEMCTCPAGFPTRKRFVLKMKTLCIGGEICRANYRFYAPVRVKFNRQDLAVVRVRRRVEVPGQLVQSSNYYMTTAGQLLAITFNDPYPYDTPYYLMIDPKAVLDPTRVIRPERIVPLRERYMCDPELKQYYEQEVRRFQSNNKVYLRSQEHVKNVLKTMCLELMADKPHRVLEYVQGFFVDLAVPGLAEDNTKHGEDRAKAWVEYTFFIGVDRHSCRHHTRPSNEENLSGM